MQKIKPVFLILLLPLATAVILGRLVQAAATPLLADTRRHVVLIGNQADVQQVADPFLVDGSLELLRTYPAPERYLFEAPTLYYPSGTPPDLALQLHAVTAPPSAAGMIVDAVRAAALPLNVIVESESLAWLSYLPGQLLTSGPCFSLDLVMEMVPGLGQPTIADLAANPGGICNDTPQIRRYPILDASQVTEKIAFIETISSTIIPQPNHLIVGATRDYIAGSPLGPIEPGAGPSRSLPQPYTGQNVRMAIFDSIPFSLSPGGRIITTFQGISLTVSYPVTLPQELPTSGRPLAGHGTFVTNAIMNLAPDADLHLLRILNDSAIGDEFTWYSAMSGFISQTLPVSSTLAGVVFNYSFGLEITPTINLTATAAMSQALTAVNQQQIVQVAATGNDSALTGTPLSMTWPARHDTTIGVTAVIWDDSGLACYANRGEVAMWGGGIARGGACTTDIVIECLDGTHPEYCVTGWDPASPTGYAFGMGTSYAAPQIAAIAAQSIEKAGSGPGSWPTPGIIRTEIYSRVTVNPDPVNIQIGVIGNQYPGVGGKFIYLPVIQRAAANNS